ncbi:glucooligosaccharide oxidase [Mycena metata]|uniref:Glucooligosaccharide oxidase n=1 Tax=Mycena metata TaxID=1033252 RepID=A0AAD7IUT4_9AGAR|nr:glucooligosaccharide oxidase [Mycena metata]
MATFLLLNLAAILLSAVAQNITDLQNTLSAHGVSAVYPMDENFTTISQAFNRRFTISPIAVAFPTSVAQVSAAVAAGAAQNLEVVARSGGHSYIANGLGGKDGALVVDMSKLKAITVRSSNNTALIETGNRLGDVALALSAKGRAMPHGTCSYVGIGGHSGYGGFGFTSRMWGLALDVVKSATVVLGNGTIVSASANVNSDLYWAIRGASPSFGIATSIEVQTFPAPPSAIVLEYIWNDLDISTATESITSFQTFAITNVPPELGAELLFTKGSSSGKVNLQLNGAWYGAPELFNATFAPYLNTLPATSSANIFPGSYIDSVVTLASPQGLDTSAAPDKSDTFYTKSLMTPSVAPMFAAAIEAFATYMTTEGFSSTTEWFAEVELYGGSASAINTVPLDSTVFAKRDTLFTIQFVSASAAPPYPAAGITFLDGMVASILNNEPADWNYGTYLNYIDDRLRNAANLYYGTHYPRLKALKAALDPKDTFRFPVGVTVA